MIIKEKPEDFIVEEVLEEDYKKNMQKIDFKNFKEKNQNYFVFKIIKKNYSHFKMLEELKKFFKTKENNIGIPGIKDKKAITTQYITIKNNNYIKKLLTKKIEEQTTEEKIKEEKETEQIKEKSEKTTKTEISKQKEETKEKNEEKKETNETNEILILKKEFEDKFLKVYLIGYSNNALTIGALKKNIFTLKLKQLEEKEIEKINSLKKTIEEKNEKENKTLLIPNYFGMQRFGIENYNPIIGYYILKKDYEKALEYIKKQINNNLNFENKSAIEIIKNMSRKKRMLYISSFQSIIFNLELKQKIKELKKTIQEENKEVEEEKKEEKTTEKTAKESEKENNENNEENNITELEYLKEIILDSLDYEFLSLKEQKRLIEKNNVFDEKIKIIAFDREMNEFKKNILKKLNLKETNFIIKQMPDLMFEPYYRSAFQKIKIEKIILEEKENNNAVIKFSLEKGSYATITIEAIKQL